MAFGSEVTAIVPLSCNPAGTVPHNHMPASIADHPLALGTSASMAHMPSLHVDGLFWHANRISAQQKWACTGHHHAQLPTVCCLVEKCHALGMLLPQNAA
eukprot:scpid55733/ scgid10421/ 